jgi:hypothetical protein
VRPPGAITQVLQTWRLCGNADWSVEQQFPGGTMRNFKCLLRRHDWHSEYDRETERTTRTCARCGATEIRVGDPTVRGIFWGLG